MPTRTCIVCRKLQDQTALIRVRQTLDGQLSTQGVTGRSVYFCPVQPCNTAPVHKDRLARALRRPVLVSELELLQKELTCQRTQWETN